MTIIDTSSWIEMLRPDGRKDVRDRVLACLQAGEARLVPMVRLELWNGARGEKEKRAVAELEQVLPELEMDGAVWNTSCHLARRARAAGLTVPASDILILACAYYHDADIESVDAHFSQLLAL